MGMHIHIIVLIYALTLLIRRYVMFSNQAWGYGLNNQLQERSVTLLRRPTPDDPDYSRTASYSPMSPISPIALTHSNRIRGMPKPSLKQCSMEGIGDPRKFRSLHSLQALQPVAPLAGVIAPQGQSILAGGIKFVHQIEEPILMWRRRMSNGVLTKPPKAAWSSIIGPRF